MTKRAYWAHYINGRKTAPMKESENENTLKAKAHRKRLKGSLYWDSAKKGTLVKPR